MSVGGYFGNKYFANGYFPDGFFGTSGEADPNAISGTFAGSGSFSGTIENGAASVFIGGVSKRRRRSGGGKFYRFETQADWDNFLRDIGELTDIAVSAPGAIEPVVDLAAVVAKVAEEYRRISAQLRSVHEIGAIRALNAEREALAAVKDYVAIVEAAENDDEEVLMILAMAA